jgi:type III protein arginine methyltransferase
LQTGLLAAANRNGSVNSPPDKKASDMLDALISRASNDPRALATLAHLLLSKGDDARARALALQARALAPGNGEIAVLTAEVLHAGVPEWHFSIVRDEPRNAAFDGALRRAVRPGMRVLDIGSGTGLLAMMAARAGAAEVVTCELNPAVAEAARKVIAANGYAGRVRVIAKHSSELDPQSDLGGPVDVMVSEIVSNEMLTEGVVRVMEQASRHLVKPAGRIIPARGSVRIALAHYPRADKRQMAMVDGLDLSPFNELSPKNFRIKWHERSLTLLSDAADLFTFDFASGGPYPEERANLSLTARSGAVNGIAQWIHLQMDDAGEYENHPQNDTASNWSILFYPLAAGLRYAAGDRVAIRASHDRHRVRIWTENTDG